ncbi:hypothetical protein GCM10009827_070240 [Dactylosporangium maewongense]|uniref:Uncharacterized protein n=1 Tax=Dactylosporangium maewongense TaxID=634393 RepID=A0ABN2BJC4_9ACTN
MPTPAGTGSVLSAWYASTCAFHAAASTGIHPVAGALPVADFDAPALALVAAAADPDGAGAAATSAPDSAGTGDASATVEGFADPGDVAR